MRFFTEKFTSIYIDSEHAENLKRSLEEINSGNLCEMEELKNSSKLCETVGNGIMKRGFSMSIKSIFN